MPRYARKRACVLKARSAEHARVRACVSDEGGKGYGRAEGNFITGEGVVRQTNKLI